MPLLPLEGPETTTHVFSLEMPLCDFCVLVPGAVDVECESGDCEPESTASILFASGCCIEPCRCDCFFDAETLIFDWVTDPADYDAEGCNFNTCRDTLVGFPDPPYTLTKLYGDAEESQYVFTFEGETGGLFTITLRCDHALDGGVGPACGCDAINPYNNCEYYLTIQCSLCDIHSWKCLNEIPSATFPLTFSSDDACAGQDACGEPCGPWEATISLP